MATRGSSRGDTWRFIDTERNDAHDLHKFPKRDLSSCSHSHGEKIGERFVSKRLKISDAKRWDLYDIACLNSSSTHEGGLYPKYGFFTSSGARPL